MRRRAPVVFLFIFVFMVAGWCFKLETVVCTGSDLRLRSGPSIENDVLGSLDKGQSLYVVKKSSFNSTLDNRDSPWFLVTTPKGKEGWVFGGYLTISSRKNFSSLNLPEQNIWLRTMARDILINQPQNSGEQKLIRKGLNDDYSFLRIFPADVGYGQPPKDIDGDGIDDLLFKLGPGNNGFSMVFFLRDNQALPLLADWDSIGMGVWEFISIEQVDFNGDNKFELMLTRNFEGDGGGQSHTDVFRSTFTGGPYNQVGQIPLGFYDFYAYAGGGSECGASRILGRKIMNVDEDPDLEMVYKLEEFCHKDPRDPNMDKYFESKITIERIIDISNNAFNRTEKILDISAKQ